MSSGEPCTVVWKHTGTGASIGACGMPTSRQVAVTCTRCPASHTVRVCDVCWGSYQHHALCGECLTPLEISPVKAAA